MLTFKKRADAGEDEMKTLTADLDARPELMK